MSYAAQRAADARRNDRLYQTSLRYDDQIQLRRDDIHRLDESQQTQLRRINALLATAPAAPRRPQ